MFYSIVGASFFLGFFLACLIYERQLNGVADAMRQNQGLESEDLEVSIPTEGWKALCREASAYMNKARVAAAGARNEAIEYSRGLSSLAHDVRTPLTGAKGYLQLAMGECKPEVAQARLRAAERRIGDVENLIDQLALYVRANDPERKYEFKTVALLPVTLEVLGGYEEDLARRAWEPVIGFADEAILVEADEGALKRIIDNLVSNALRHGNGSLRLIQKSNDSTWTLEIANLIKGDARPDESGLFERFRGEGTKRLNGGLGLGLSTAKKLAEDMGWTLEANMDGEVLGFVLSGKTIENG